MSRKSSPIEFHAFLLRHAELLRAVREWTIRLLFPRSLSQAELARRLKSSRPRVAKIDAGDPSVSTDLLLRALFALGATPRDVASEIRRGRPVSRVTTVAKMSPRRRWI